MRLEPLTGFDPKNRELCPDGSCIGVIGRDGRCRECGTELPGYTAAPAEEVEGAEVVAEPEPAPVEPPVAASVPPASDSDAFDPDSRELCPDGACIGVIGRDGRCKVCGEASK